MVVECELGPQVLSASCDAQIVPLMGSRVLEKDLAPISIRVMIGILRILGCVGVDEFLRVLRERAGCSIVVLQVIHDPHPVHGIGKLGTGSGLVDGVEIVVIHGELVLLGTFGRDQDNTGGSPGSVDGSRRGVLEDRDVLNILGCDIVQGTRDSVDDDQRAVLRHGRDTVDADCSGSTGLTGGAGYLQTGNHTLKCRGKLILRTFRHILAPDT